MPAKSSQSEVAVTKPTVEQVIREHRLSLANFDSDECMDVLIDEIEKLKAQKKTAQSNLKTSSETFYRVIDSLRSENQKFRAALEEIQQEECTIECIAGMNACPSCIAGDALAEGGSK